MQKGKNELALSIDEIVKATAGQLLSSGEGTYFTNACVDSRMAGPGSIFFALKGEQTDGHLFVPAAASQGAIQLNNQPVLRMFLFSLLR